MSRIISVAGPASATSEELGVAEEVGRLLGEAGVTVVCGGMGGVMEAVCRGARNGGGMTVGILPGVDRKEANRYVDLAIPTGLGEARNVLVARAGDSLIAISGEYGTLSEVAMALKLEIPVVGLRTWELRKDGVPDGGIQVAADPREAVRLALNGG